MYYVIAEYLENIYEEKSFIILEGDIVKELSPYEDKTRKPYNLFDINFYTKKHKNIMEDKSKKLKRLKELDKKSITPSIPLYEYSEGSTGYEYQTQVAVQIARDRLSFRSSNSSLADGSNNYSKLIKDKMDDVKSVFNKEYSKLTQEGRESLKRFINDSVNSPDDIFEKFYSVFEIESSLPAFESSIHSIFNYIRIPPGQQSGQQPGQPPEDQDPPGEFYSIIIPPKDKRRKNRNFILDSIKGILA